MRDRIKLIINFVLVCITIERAFAEFKKDHQRKNARRQH